MNQYLSKLMEELEAGSWLWYKGELRTAQIGEHTKGWGSLR